MEQVKDTVVSYLVASFNHEAYILECLESIKADNFQPSEIIIIDDGSTDSSVSLIQKWIEANSQLKIKFVHRANLGIAATLNELFRSANGLYYRTVSSDDTIKPGSTAQLMSELKNHQNVLVAFGDVETIDEKSRLVAESHMQSLNHSKNVYQTDLKRAIISKWAVCGPCWLLTKDFYKKIGLFDESLIIEDWNMYLRLVAKNSIVFTDKTVASYRIHGLNTSRTRNVDRRIVNLKSQISAGQKNLENFNGAYRLLLSGELNLLRAKVQYLSKNFVLTAWYLGIFILSNFVSRIQIWSEGLRKAKA